MLQFFRCVFPVIFLAVILSGRFALAEIQDSQNFWQQDLEDREVDANRRVGLASWYGGKFHGRRTASGERYDKHQMTCASRHLPFGTLLEVTNLANGRTAVVRVNDRGPFSKNRVLDFSYAVAQKLGFVGTGVTQVAFTVLSSHAVAD